MEVQILDPGDLVTLFVLDATALGGSTYRFTSSAWESANVIWDGDTYTPLNVEADGFEWNGKGTLPTPTLRVGNVGGFLASAVEDFDDLVGATLTRIRTFKQYLDDGSSPDTTAKFPDDVFKVERKTAHNKVFMEWELSASLDQEGRMVPGRQVLRDACTHKYRFYDTNTADFDYTNSTCPYTGTSYFDQEGNSCSKSEDRCGKKLSDCKLRFGTNGVLPTRAFPGSSRVR